MHISTMAEIDSKEVQKQLLALGQALRSLSSSLGTTINVKESSKMFEEAAEASAKVNASFSKGLGGAQKKFLNKIEDLIDSTSDASKSLSAYHKSVRVLTDVVEDTSDMLGESKIQQAARAKRMVSKMDELTQKFSGNIKASSLLLGEQLRSVKGFKQADITAYSDALHEVTSTMSKGLLKQMKLLEEDTGELRKNLRLNDFKRLAQVSGDIRANISKYIGTAGAPSLHQMGSGQGQLNDKAISALLAISAELQSRGMDVPKQYQAIDANGNRRKISDINPSADPHVWAAMAKELAKSDDELAKIADDFQKTRTRFDSEAGRFVETFKNVNARNQAIADKVSGWLEGITAGGLMAKAIGHLKQAWGEILEFNVAQIPASFMQMQTQSVSLGMSFKELMQVTQETKLQMTTLGSSYFSTIKAVQGNFKKYGFDSKQSAELIGPAIDAAIASGANSRSSEALKSATDEQINSAQRLASVTGLSVKQILQLNTQLAKNTSVQATLLGMDKSRRQAYTQELIRLRESYVARGMEVEEAQKLVELQQAQQRDKVQTRMGDAGKMMAMGAMAGLDGQSNMRMYMLLKKGRRTSAEDSELQGYMAQINRAKEQQVTDGYGPNGDGLGGYAYQNAYDTQMEGISGNTRSMMDAATNGQLRNDAGAGVSNKEITQASEKAKGSKAVADASTAINQVSSLMGNHLVAALVAATASLWMFSGSAGLKGIMGMLGKFGGLGRLAGGAATVAEGASAAAAGGSTLASGGALAAGGGILARAKGIGGNYIGKVGGAGTMMRGVGSGIGLGVAGLGADYLADSLGRNTTGGKVADTASYALKGAGLGATLGTIIPGVGNVVGGVVGGVLGAGYGLYQNWGGGDSTNGLPPDMLVDQDTIRRQQMAKSDQDMRQVNREMGGAAGTMSVYDASNASGLKQVASHLQDVVALLQQVIDGKAIADLSSEGKPKTAVPKSNIATAPEFMAGKANASTAADTASAVA